MADKPMTEEELRAKLDDPNLEIRLAATDDVDALESWVDVVLEALEHPEALVTDLSAIWDFQPFNATKAEKEQWLAGVQAKLGVKFTLGSSLVDVARLVKEARS